TSSSSNDHKKENFTLKISKTLQTNLDNLQNMLDKPDDLKVRELKLGQGNISCAITYIEGIVDSKTIQLSILNNLESAQNLPTEAKELFDFIYNKLIFVNNVQKGYTLDDLSLQLLSGHTILYVDGVDTVLMI